MRTDVDAETLLSGYQAAAWFLEFFPLFCLVKPTSTVAFPTRPVQDWRRVGPYGVLNGALSNEVGKT
jgi:hypothetical protein